MFNRRARLDPGQVRDMRGGRGVGGRGLAIGGGGIGAVVLAIAYVLLGGDPSDLGAITQPGGGGNQGAGSSTLQEECRTGADANEREDCQIVGYVNSIQDYWGEAYQGYREAETTIFESSISTGCGTATSQVGPFYCPSDQGVYLDLGFFDQLRELGADDASLARGYVLAHEYGHHVQNLDRILSRAQDGDTGPDSAAVRIELMADCFAGAWAKNAEETGFLEPLTETQIADALEAAAAVGDDRIQKRVQGRVTPENWTHGSSEERQGWFLEGYQSGSPRSCDTFAQ
jgi:predicted metalloprotease